MDSVHVAIRIREQATSSVWKYDTTSIYHEGKPYTFDRVFSNESNGDIYTSVAQEIINSFVSGVNGTIFVYGQTSTGKTFTMSGLMPLIAQDVFAANEDEEVLVRVSYMEIYNEVIKDLLDPSNENLKIHETVTKEIYVGNLKETVVLNPSDLMQVLNKGNIQRTVFSTNMNDRSSRSHTIFRIVLESKSQGRIRISCLNLVDLAGSERVQWTGAEGMRLKEAQNINKSLLALSTVISKLSEDRQHIPYRDSKLTRILQPSLGGNARCLVICTVTTDGNFVEETLSTLKFASRAKRIKNKPEVNEIISDETLMERYKQEIERLKKELERQNKRPIDSDEEHDESFRKKRVVDSDEIFHEDASIHKQEFDRIEAEYNQLQTENEQLQVERAELMSRIKRFETDGDRHEKELENLAKVKEELEIKVKVALERVEQLQKDIQTLEHKHRTEVDNMTSVLKDSSGDAEKLREALNTAEEDLQDLRSCINKSSEEKRLLEAELKHLKNSHDELESKLNALEEANANSNVKYEDLLSTMRVEHDTRVADFDSLIAALNSDKEELGKKLSEALQDVEAKETVISELMADNKTLQTSKASIEQQQVEAETKFKAEVTELQSTIAQLQGNKAELETCLSSAEGEKRELNLFIAVLQADNQELNGAYDTLFKEKNDFEVLSLKLNDERNALLKDKDNLVKAAEMMEAEKSSLVASFESAINEKAKIEDQLKHLTMTNSELIFQNEGMQEDLNDLTAAYESFKTETESLKQAKMIVETELVGLKQQYVSLDDEKQKLGLDYEKQVQLNSVLSHDYAVIDFACDELRVHHDLLKDSNAKLQDSLDSLTSDRDCLRIENETLRADKNAFHEEIQSLSTEKSGLQTCISELHCIIEQGKQELAALTERFNDEQGRLNSLLADLNAHNAKLAKEVNDFSEEKVQLLRRQDDLHREVIQLNESKCSAENQAIELEFQLQEVVKCSEETLRTLKRATEIESELSSELEVKKAEYSQFVCSHEELQFKLSELTEAKCKLQNMNEGLLQRITESDINLKQFDSRCRLLKSEKDEAIMTVEKLSSDIHELQTSNAELSRLNADLNISISQLQTTTKELTEWSSGLKQRNEVLHEDNQALKNEAKVLIQTMEPLKREVVELRESARNLEKLKGHASSVEMQLAEAQQTVTSLRTELLASRSRIDDLSTLSDTQSQAIEKVRLSEASLKQKLEEVTDHYTKLEVEHSKLSSEFQLLDSEANEHKSESRELAFKVKQLQKEKAELEDKFLDLKHQYEKLMIFQKDFEQEKKHIEELRTSEASEVAQTKEAYAQIVGKLAEMDNSNANLLSEVSRYKSAVEQLETEKAELEARVHGLSSTEHKLRARFEASSQATASQIKELQDSNTRFSKDLSAVKKEYDELVEKSALLFDNFQKKNDELDKVQEELQSVGSENHRLLKEMNQLFSIVKELQKKEADLNETIEDYERNEKQLKELVNESRNKYLELEAKMMSSTAIILEEKENSGESLVVNAPPPPPALSQPVNKKFLPISNDLELLRTDLHKDSKPVKKLSDAIIKEPMSRAAQHRRNRNQSDAESCQQQ